MIAVRGIGWVLAVLGLVVLGRDILAWHDTGTFAPISLGQLWLELNRASIKGIENALAPWMMHILRLVLSFWAAATFLLLGLVIVFAARNGQAGRRRRR